tara:strand:+ start:184 stop:444 length:261 start_codon:yes stop_codon:yes gene_type:complete
MTDSTFKPSMTKRYDVEINERLPVGQYWAIHNSFDTFEEAEQEIIDCLYSGTDSDDSSDYRISVKILDSSESLYRTYGGHANWNWY